MEGDNKFNDGRRYPIVPVMSTPQPVKEVEADPAVIAFAKELQKHRKTQSCGGGHCGMKYEIPAYIIDAYANATPKK